jgi:cyclophilin family peptidyl-prolyl cis-trans isomerase
MPHRLLTILALAAVLASPAAAQPAPAPNAAAAGERVVLETSHGTMTIRLFPAEAPATVAQFKRLVSEGFYDGKPFYRVVAGHVIQTGDGGENDQPTVPLEAGGHPHVEGAVGLARDSDPDSGSTEIYLCLAPRPHLDGRYAVFGQLDDGFEVLRAIGAVEVEEKWVGDDGQVAFHEPRTPVLIERAWIEGAGAAAGDAAP